MSQAIVRCSWACRYGLDMIMVAMSDADIEVFGWVVAFVHCQRFVQWCDPLLKLAIEHVS
jgi:hypothetical protein